MERVEEYLRYVGEKIEAEEMKELKREDLRAAFEAAIHGRGKRKLSGDNEDECSISKKAKVMDTRKEPCGGGKLPGEGSKQTGTSDGVVETSGLKTMAAQAEMCETGQTQTTADETTPNLEHTEDTSTLVIVKRETLPELEIFEATTTAVEVKQEPQHEGADLESKLEAPELSEKALQADEEEQYRSLSTWFTARETTGEAGKADPEDDPEHVDEGDQVEQEDQEDRDNKEDEDDHEDEDDQECFDNQEGDQEQEIQVDESMLLDEA